MVQKDDLRDACNAKHFRHLTGLKAKLNKNVTVHKQSLKKFILVASKLREHFSHKMYFLAIYTPVLFFTCRPNNNVTLCISNYQNSVYHHNIFLIHF